jgi:hypothetical protein
MANDYLKHATSKPKYLKCGGYIKYRIVGSCVTILTIPKELKCLERLVKLARRRKNDE